MAPTRPRSMRALAFGNKRNSSPGPPSPTFSDTTNVSAMNFGADGPEKIITRANLKASLQAYDQLMSTSANYRQALKNMSNATAAFADAMEACSGLKGPSYEAGTRLQAASGLQHLIGNHWHVLAETIDKKFEKPLLQHLDTYKTIVHERSASYERALREKSQVIKDTEMRNMNKKERNLQSFREALSVLQRQVDDLDDIKAAHYQEILEHEEEVWDVVQAKICVVVRSTMDVFDRFTAKASDPVIEPMLQAVPDPFDSYGPPQAEDQIFSILPPLSIMTGPASTSASATPTMTTPELSAAEGLPPTTSSSRTNSWTQSNGFFPSESTEWADLPSPSSTPTPPRSISPPSTSQRRHSVPPTTGHHPRRSESSKLRSVLTVIDESHSRQPSHSSEAESNTPYTPDDTKAPSPLIQPQPEKKSTFSWTSPFLYGQSPYDNGNEPDETPTPRSSSFSKVPPPPPALDPSLALATEVQKMDGEEVSRNAVSIPVTT